MPRSKLDTTSPPKADLRAPIEKLRRVLEHERDTGYQDRAVVGGLDAFLRRWTEGLPGGELPTPLASSLGAARTRPYKGLSLEQRCRWLESALGGLAGTHASPTKTRSVGETGGTARGPVPQSPRRAKVAVAIGLESSITALPGVNVRLASRFEQLGVGTIRELLYFFPHRHNDFSAVKPIAELEVGQAQTVVAQVWEARATRLGRSMRGSEATLGDETGNIRAVWFNNPYVARQLQPNSRVVVSGLVSVFRGQRVFESPEWEPFEGKEVADLVHTGRLVPVYPLTAGLQMKGVRRIVKQAVDRFARSVADVLPADLRRRNDLLEVGEAIAGLHYPRDAQSLEQARRRHAFEELFLIQLGMLRRKRLWQQSGHAPELTLSPQAVSRFLEALPFRLTMAQRRALEDLRRDVAQGTPMSRLLQGDVGSGKTVVAAAGLLAAVESGCQGVIMAPTEVLAEQHFATLASLLSTDGSWPPAGEVICEVASPLQRPLKVGLLTSRLKPSQKEEVLRLAASGELDVVVGTHALIQEGVAFHRVGLAIVDEQHRFGVRQRASLRQKGESPHLLVMTATPIPRSLALTLYGDLEISVIGELPPGRRAVQTKWLPAEEREDAYQFIHEQVSQGRQAFLIYSLIEESDSIEAKAAVAEYERLKRDVFRDLRLGLLHGRMGAIEKDDVMRRFRNGELDLLLSTPVVEVGIDIPNATVMLVDGADRFGLAQLHQFRGRVGRGEHQSYCLLLADIPTAEARERLRTLERVSDGFLLAEEDLRLRGPGEFFGTRQSGLPDLKVARISDLPLLELAREEARLVFAADPDLNHAENHHLSEAVERLWPQGAGDPS